MFEHEEQAFFASLIAEYQYPFNGWDFSHLDNRMLSIRTNAAWDYTATILAAMKQTHTLLDMHTGGGERLAHLLSLQPVPETYATELYPPNVILAQQRLSPLGVTVYTAPDDHLPFANTTLDLVINRHGSYNPSEVLRILKPERLFITQQVGDQTNTTLHTLLGRKKTLEHPWNKDYAVQHMEAAGWQIIEQEEEFSTTRFLDVGAIVYYLKAIPWEVPDFSIEHYWPKLVEIHQRLAQQGFIDVLFHSFFLVARKPS